MDITSKTSKEFCELSKSRGVWDALLRRCIIEEGIPIPGLAGRSLESLNAQELERFHRRALELRRNWHSESPVIKQSFRLVSSAARILRLYVLPGDSGRRWLVSMAKTYGQYRKYVIRCWDLCQEHPVCVAQREFERLGGLAINRRNEHDCIAVLTPR